MYHDNVWLLLNANSCVLCHISMSFVQYSKASLYVCWQMDQEEETLMDICWKGSGHCFSSLSLSNRFKRCSHSCWLRMSGSGKAKNLRELYVSSKKLLTTGKGIQCPIVKSFPTFRFSKLEADKWLQVSNLQYVPPASSLPSNLCRHVGGRSSLALQQLVLSSLDASQMLHTRNACWNLWKLVIDEYCFPKTSTTANKKEFKWKLKVMALINSLQLPSKQNCKFHSNSIQKWANRPFRAGMLKTRIHKR